MSDPVITPDGGIKISENFEDLGVSPEGFAPPEEPPAPPAEGNPPADTPASEGGGNPPSEEAQKPDFGPVFKTLGDGLGISVNSADDILGHFSGLQAKLNELEGKDPYGTLPEFVRKGVEFALKSDDPDKAYMEWAKIQGTDYNVLLKEDPESLVLQGLKNEFGDALDKQGIKDLFDTKFPPVNDEDYADDAAYNRAVNLRKVQIIAEAKKYADEMNKLKEERSVPDQTKREQNAQKHQEELRKKYHAKMEDAIRSIHGTGIEIDGVTYRVDIVGKDSKVTDAARNAYNAIQDPIKWLNETLWDPELGQPDPNKVFMMQYLMDNYAEIAKAVGNGKKSEGILETLKGPENPSGHQAKPPEPKTEKGADSTTIGRIVGFI